MTPTEQELLAYLRQLKTDNPQLTKAELTARALKHFAPLKQQELEIYLPAGKPAAMTLGEQPETELIQAADSQRESEPIAAVRPLLERKARIARLIAAVFIAAVMAGTSLFVMYAPPALSREELLALTADLKSTPPLETGDVARLGKRFAGSATYYDKKYRNQVIELVGTVESLERTADGDFQVTLALPDRKQTAFSARFRFLPEQQEVLQLAPGTIVVLKGRYIKHSDKVMEIYPSVIVFNSVH